MATTMFTISGPTPEELEEIAKKEMLEIEKAARERQEVEEAAIRQKRHEEWVWSEPVICVLSSG